MSTVERVRVPVSGSVPGGATNAYLVGNVLVDPAARSAALDALVAGADIAHVACTHTHPDHVGALAQYATETDATVWAHAPHADRFERASGVAPDRTFREGDAIGPLVALATPGHAPDHVAFAHGDGYLVGDCCRADGSVAIGTDGDMRAYLTSLRRLHARAPERLYPGHGPPIAAPGERLAALVAHRRERESRVLRAVEAGARTLDAVVDAAYDADLTGVREQATATASAHLEKLAVEGRVEWDGSRATPVGSD
ncbi:MBL fold metallo-hydrolase [Halarchaeum sp. CBA1220]|uniref:MBL fold metallo-hydrolase n=1 Tax=Halarchaeum sp. CBA1220 TaxID=1853682 RepID=UPI000F3AA97F|nr:MBL fold metallo-hydrolase [Halarchaeum sp. CBA1220]QLC33769.1 MBL fold metallo-hydrolase [Halarchaeum sp. CBA1220]